LSGAALRDLAGRDVWVFDLDNTLYPAEHEVFDEIGERMTRFIARVTGFEHEAARVLREKYFLAYGATVVGVVKHHGASAADFLSYVHDVSFDAVHPDPELARLIARLPGRRIVFTNGARDYAVRILSKLGMDRSFDAVFALEDADLVPKPQRAAFDRFIAHSVFDPVRAVLFDDHDRNLETAADLGFATVHVGPPMASASFVDFSTPDLHAFLRGLVEPSIDHGAGIA
jgi:putative hydrolase of the HAD superfamily